jgi:hypothetical protein
MGPLQLLKRYGREYDPLILSQYEAAERFVWVNTNDKDLIPIKIDLPEVPDYHLIDGFGQV